MTFAIPFIAGFLLGLAYFFGLWWTLQRFAKTSTPSLWLGLSSLGRLALLLGGVLAVTGGAAIPLIACLFGFFAARAAALHRAKASVLQGPTGDI